MKKDRRSLSDQLADIVRRMMDEIERWEYERVNGCNDPSWTDGCNMNLVRNHVIDDKRRIEEFCQIYQKPDEDRSKRGDLFTKRPV